MKIISEKSFGDSKGQQVLFGSRQQVFKHRLKRGNKMSKKFDHDVKTQINKLDKYRAVLICKKYSLSKKGRKIDLITRIISEVSVEDIVPFFYVVELKDILERQGLSNKGVKDELKKRVLSFIKPQKGETEQVETPIVEPKQEVIHLHKEIKEKLVELGRVFGWYSQEEYKDRGLVIDVVWKEREQLPIRKAFEVQHRGDVKGALVNLQHAHDWRADLFLIITDEKDRIKAEELFEGAFHNIKEFTKMIPYIDFMDLYKTIMSHKDIIEKMVKNY